MLSHNYGLQIIATWKFTYSLPPSAQDAITKGILRQTGDFCCHENKL